MRKDDTPPIILGSAADKKRQHTIGRAFLRFIKVYLSFAA